MRYFQMIEKIVGGRKAEDLNLPNLPSEQALKDFIKHQQPSGAFLSPDPTLSPEARWFDEMVILHHLAARAIGVNDPATNKAVKKAAEYHLQEIQPDHATADPWALLAYIQYASPLADQVLHAMQMQYPEGPHGLPLLLLTDVLYGLQRLMKEQDDEQ